MLVAYDDGKIYYVDNKQKLYKVKMISGIDNLRYVLRKNIINEHIPNVLYARDMKNIFDNELAKEICFTNLANLVMMAIDMQDGLNLDIKIECKSFIIYGYCKIDICKKS